ncbi:hypothetical protein DL765_011045 [Monosporascus sp. GIB2]|nr:hypothetical protein DL765_011045 [Monosporascus sp. GIB2]
MAAPTERRNALLMVADDLGLMLGCYGLGAIRTPRVDQLAAQGTRFTNAFASTASCSGSRSAICTGLHTHQNGQCGLQQGWCHFETHEHIETAPRVFNSLGYQTGILGKVHPGPREVYPWEWYRPSLSRDVRQNAAEAARFFDKAAETGRLFHLIVGLQDPHRDETVLDYKAADVEIPPFIGAVPELRTELAEYYKPISRMGLGVGLILGELAKRGLDRNTLVSFVSDNGSRSSTPKPRYTTPAILPTCIEWADVQDSDVKTSNTGKSPPRKGTSFLRVLGDSNALPSETWTHHVFGSHTFHEQQNYWSTRFVLNHGCGRGLEDWQYETEDPWLFRDGVSVMTTHAAQKLGMRLPDRFDIDPKNAGSSAGPHWAPRSAKSSAGSMEFG